jgi:hypothetical protein
MNVLKELMVVLILVPILLGATPAPVIQDIAWQVMDEHATVSPVLDLHYVLARELQ